MHISIDYLALIILFRCKTERARHVNDSQYLFNEILCFIQFIIALIPPMSYFYREVSFWQAYRNKRVIQRVSTFAPLLMTLLKLIILRAIEYS